MKILSIIHHREMQLKTIMRRHFTSIRMAVSKRQTGTTNKDAKNLDLSHSAGGNVKWSGKQSGNSTVKHRVPIWSSHPTPSLHTQGKTNTRPHKNFHVEFHSCICKIQNWKKFNVQLIRYIQTMQYCAIQKKKKKRTTDTLSKSKNPGNILNES